MMSDTKKQKMQDKVAKLLRQAEDVAGTPEEGVFQAKAFELMAKYGIEQAEVEATKAGLDMTEMPDAIQWTVDIAGKYVAQQALLLHGIARALHCKTVYTTLGKAQRVYVFGMERHIDRAKFLWEILRPQMLRLVDKVRPDAIPVRRFDYELREFVTTGYRKATAGETKAYRRAWIAGFAQSVGDRVRAEEDKALEGAGGALVLYRDDKARAGAALARVFPRVRNVKSRARYDSNGYAHGQRDGRSAAMQRSIA
ncbi:hypothetical protein TRIXIE_84 [Mycobacterium phage Trixie]|uniref:Uncharacterized protein n=1 Tax=Mycobacterium phage Trixie TaxID=1071503 RepID=G1JV42_9CAUD|nr:hypothetical protein TRIXIE_84 [Mycobacterium phage Trixie]AEL17876.1 hypothetical protein TRIXIE_84 [Mycobacterium phage Trixie]